MMWMENQGYNPDVLEIHPKGKLLESPPNCPFNVDRFYTQAMDALSERIGIVPA